MSEETDGKSAKKPYVKPALTEIKLVPGESALAGCKYNGMAGPNQAAVLKCQALFGDACRTVVAS
jgi:hypothetical protein